MLHITIDGKEAVLKKGSSIELVTENRRFSSSDSYTLDISFPLKDCHRNIEIFGSIFRTDIMPQKLKFVCVISAGNFHKSGTLVITEFSNVEVKGQFLEGRSGSAITSPIADTYINELDLGYPDTDKSKVSARQAWSASSIHNAVALPWVNDSSGNMQNKVVFKDGDYSWHEDCQGLSWQLYLHSLITRIGNAIGYNVDVSAMTAFPKFRYILVCNTLPYAWEIRNFARALPHWTVEEFLGHLELFLNGEFEIDHEAKSIVFRIYSDIQSHIEAVAVRDTVNDFTAEVFVEDSDCMYVEAVNIEFKECSHAMWKYYSCDWFIKESKSSVKSYDTLADLISVESKTYWDPTYSWGGYWKQKSMRDVFYVKEIDTHFCLRGLFPVAGADAFNKFQMMPINEYGKRIVIDDDDAETRTMKIVPACIMEADEEYWWTLYLSMSGYSEDEQEEDSSSDSSGHQPKGPTADEISAISVNRIKAGSKDVSEYFDNLYVGWWNGLIQEDGFNPFPNVSNIYISHDFTDVKKFDFDFRLNSKNCTYGKSGIEIDNRVKYSIDFLSDHVPDVRAVFIIQGKRYLCEKLTANMSDQGLSALVKGTFWRIKD